MPSCTKRPMRCLSILNTWVRLITPCSGKLSSAHEQTHTSVAPLVCTLHWPIAASYAALTYVNKKATQDMKISAPTGNISGESAMQDWIGNFQDGFGQLLGRRLIGQRNQACSGSLSAEHPSQSQHHSCSKQKGYFYFTVLTTHNHTECWGQAQQHTCSKGLFHFTSDGEGLMGAAPEHSLQLGDQHDGLQRCHLRRHQLAHTQLVAHHALVRLQGSLQLQ